MLYLGDYFYPVSMLASLSRSPGGFRGDGMTLIRLPLWCHSRYVYQNIRERSVTAARHQMF